MYDVIGVRLVLSNNICYFNPNKLNIEKNDVVIVEDDKVSDYGVCATEIIKKKKDELYLPLKKVIRKATKEDQKIIESNRYEASSAMTYARRAVKELELDMNIVSAYYTFDRSRLYFSFTADDRIDFRNLAKKLAQKYKTRIELRQIGVRDKAKLVGGIGPCGLLLCCNTFLTDFNSVSINMAKNQFLALNPTKINGVCGRLLCCLNYEDEVYTELKKELPSIGSIVDTEYGKGKVISLDVLKKTYQVQIDNDVYDISVN